MFLVSPSPNQKLWMEPPVPVTSYVKDQKMEPPCFWLGLESLGPDTVAGVRTLKTPKPLVLEGRILRVEDKQKH